MVIAYVQVQPADAGAFAAFLAAEQWPFHAGGPVDAAAVAGRVAAGEYFSATVWTFWVVVDGVRCGFVRAFDLADANPLFDLRIGAAHRGRGLGTAATGWLVGRVFTALPQVHRIEGTTRVDNVAMRAVFRACGFVKEAHYRAAWPDAAGALRDAVGYAILRNDWLSGTVTPVDWES